MSNRGAKCEPDIFFDFEVNGKPLGRVIFRLYDDVVPNTAKNFRELATGVHPFGYRGTPIHRIVPDFMIQGGDVTKMDGTGGRSIYGEKFYDESFKMKHSKPGLLSMANMGYNTNSSQFFITTCPAPWINGRNVVFGEVISGYHHVLYIQENFATDDILRRPRDKIVIARCGSVAPNSK